MACPILLIKVIVILTNKKDFIIVGNLAFKEGDNVFVEIYALARVFSASFLAWHL